MQNQPHPVHGWNDLVLSLLVAGITCLLAASSLALAQDNSPTRVVRLSFVEGTVGVLPPGSSDDWAQASVNTPIEQGYQLATQKDSFAEVQFEDASTLRLGELSSVHLDELTLTDSGNRDTMIRFDSGYGTVHVLPAPRANLQVIMGDLVLVAEGACEFRIDRTDQAVRIEMWSGTALVAGAAHESIELQQNQVLTYAVNSGEPYDVESGITADDWDHWVASRDQAQASQPASVTPGNFTGLDSNNLYGWSDLGNYGVWTYYSNVGYAWCPTMPAGWSPYSFGRWIWYPGFGFTWVSFEPWGWLPYHYGQWTYLPASGWAWVPQSFASWSPALVTWYQGPGWIGWTPQFTGRSPGVGVPCPTLAQGCFRAVSIKKFQDGVAVTPRGLLRVDPQEGRRVQRLDLHATRLVMLPGTPLAHDWISAVRPKHEGEAAPTFRARSARPGTATSGKAPPTGNQRPVFRSGYAPTPAQHTPPASKPAPAAAGGAGTHPGVAH